MKTIRIHVGLIAAVALALNQPASASLAVGFYRFENMRPVAATDNPADYYVNPGSGLSGWVTSPRQASTSFNGSWDTTYGDGPSTLPSQPPGGYLPPGDGMGVIRVQGLVPDPGQGQPDYSVLSFWITNTGPRMPLNRVYFDAVCNPPLGTANQTVLVRYWKGDFDPAQSDTWWELGTPVGPAGGYGLGPTTGFNDYNDHSANLSGMFLETGETVAIMFSGDLVINPGNYYTPSPIYVDNVGIGNFPDPPLSAYQIWLQAKFPGEYGNATLEASVWGDHADPDGDGCGNLLEFMMAREPKVPDGQHGPQCRIDGNDLVVTYRETTAANPGVTWQGQWSVDAGFWVAAGPRYQTLSTHTGYRMVEARISRNQEQKLLFRLKAQR